MSKLLRVSFILALVCVLRAAVWGAEFQVNTYTTDHQTSPAVAADAAGNFVVVWESFLVKTAPV
jgi:uncharacterized membrane protein